jgi:hypothetical protein
MRNILSLFFISAYSILLSAQTVPSYVPTNGLVGWWPFNGNANDESGNGNNGTVNGATLTNDRNGVANSAYSFDGLNCCGTPDPIQEIATNAFINLGQDQTISCWMKSSNVSKFQQMLFYAGTAVALNNENAPNILNYSVGNGSSWNLLYGPGTFNSFQNNTWYHVVLVKSSTTYSLYLNNVLDGSSVVPASSTYNQIVPLIIGALGNGYEIFKGTLDDFGIWNRVLTQQEITALYNGCQLSVNTQPSNQTELVGTNAQFVISTSNPNATYQWQTDLGLGFQNISNAGQYSGATNDTLTISNLSISNNNQLFRCIITSGSCVDTSDVAVLTVNTSTSTSSIPDEFISVLPNPNNGVFEIGQPLEQFKIQMCLITVPQ